MSDSRSQTAREFRISDFELRISSNEAFRTMNQVISDCELRISWLGVELSKFEIRNSKSEIPSDTDP